MHCFAIFADGSIIGQTHFIVYSTAQQKGIALDTVDLFVKLDFKPLNIRKSDKTTCLCEKKIIHVFDC